MTHIGSEKGGWIIPSDHVEKNWVCFCVGVGDDITFDLGLIERYDCIVHAFDPTPRAIEFLKSKRNLPSKFIFHPIGIWKENIIQKFYAPKVDVSTNFSIKNLEKTDEYIEAECKTIKTVMEDLSFNKIDLLKLDIEGAEHEVIDHLYRARIMPKILCVEFDQPTSLFSMLNSIRKLKKIGFELININIFDFTFIHQTVRS